MSKKNLPHIQLYIGDWERDCNVLSLEAEMAWMKIIFKMHLSGNCIYQSSAKTLQILWKSTVEIIDEIISELKSNSICEITLKEGVYTFLCRRLAKEEKLSQTRSNSAKKRYNKTEEISKTPANTLQNSDSDIDFDIEGDIDFGGKDVYDGKEGTGEKPNPVLPFPSAEFASQWDNWKNYKAMQHSFSYISTESEQAALLELNTLSNYNETTAIAILHQSMSRGWKGLFELNPKGNAGKPTASGKSATGYSNDFQRKIAERLQSG